MRDSLAGCLLVAQPGLLDPNFRQTVVLLCAHDRGGAFGLVLNRPLEITVQAVLPAWGTRLGPDDVLFHGGPVEPDSAFGIARDPSRTVGEHIIGDLCQIDLSREPEASPGLRAVRAFIGCAGWAAGQLEAELLGEGWRVVDPAPDDAFTIRPATLWAEALQRPVSARATLPHVPAAPSQN